MRHINKEDFIEFRFEESGFSFTSTRLDVVVELFEGRQHGTIYGRKVNGDTAILDSK